VSFTYAFDAGGGKCSSVSCHGGFCGYWGAQSDCGKLVNATTNVSLGAGCYEVIGTVSQINSQLWFTIPPYTYDWDFGDGDRSQPSTGTTSTLPIVTSHVYPAKQTYTVTFRFRDGNHHDGKTVTWAYPQAVNVPPAVNMEVTLSKCTATLVDRSTDSDFDTCGHGGGPGSTTILWGDSSRTDAPLQLTRTPSGQSFSHTYGIKTSYSITYYARDNVGVAGSVSYGPFSITPPTIEITGHVATPGGASVANAWIDLLGPGGNTYKATTTDGAGNYAFHYNSDYCAYTLRPRSSTLYTFSPSEKVVDPWAGAQAVEFVANPIP
jgi:hypothetical protein